MTGLPGALARVAEALEDHQGRAGYDTTPWWTGDWAAHLDRSLPEHGIGSDAVLDLLTQVVVPHGIPSDAAGFTGWIFTSPPVVPTAARVVASRVGPQRYLGFAPGLCESVALRWVAQLFAIPASHAGVFASGGSGANLIGLGAARQHAYERRHVDPARDGLGSQPLPRVYGSVDVHHCHLKNAGILGLGRQSVRLVPVDQHQRMSTSALRSLIRDDLAAGHLPVAVVASAGTVHTGAIDPINEIADVCEEFGVWLHVDGAYGLPGRLDPRIADRFEGLERADSVAVDLHKWLAVPTGVGVAYVRDEGLLGRAFTAEPSAYIEGQFAAERAAARSAWEWMGPPYADWSVELSAPAQGIVVWAALAEIGSRGFAERVAHHRDLARRVHDRAAGHPRLEPLHEPELSIAGFRYVGDSLPPDRLDQVNEQILAALRLDGSFAPSGTLIDGRFAIRPCFITPWVDAGSADGLVNAVVDLGDALSADSAVAG